MIARKDILALVLLLFCFVANGEERKRLSDEGAKELRAAYLTYLRAIRDNDSDVAKTWIGAGRGHDDGVLITEILLAGNAFQDAMIERFGEEVAKRFPGSSDRQIEQLEQEVSAPATVVEGLEAFATISRHPKEGDPIVAIGFSGEIQIMARKSNGRWQQVLLPTSSDDAAEREKLESLLKLLLDLEKRVSADESLTEEGILETFREQVKR